MMKAYSNNSPIDQDIIIVLISINILKSKYEDSYTILVSSNQRMIM